MFIEQIDLKKENINFCWNCNNCLICVFVINAHFIKIYCRIHIKVMRKARLDSLSRPLGEEGNPLHSPDVSSTRLRGGPDTTLKTSKQPWLEPIKLRT